MVRQCTVRGTFLYRFLITKPRRDRQATDTRSIGPPECCRDFRYLSYENLSVGPGADIWSLGCVFSEALVWSTMREDGRIGYEQRRVDATKSVPGIADAGYGGCFHKIDSRLKVVDDMHQEAKKYSQRDDKITSLTSTIILKHMLQPHLDDRLPPTNLHRIFKNEVEGAIGSQSMAKSNDSGSNPPADQGNRQEQRLDDPSVSREKHKSKTWTSGTSSTDDTQRRQSSNLILHQDMPNPARQSRAQNPGQHSAVELPDVSVKDVNAWREREGGVWNRFIRGQRDEPDGMANLRLLNGRDQVRKKQHHARGCLDATLTVSKPVFPHRRLCHNENTPLSGYRHIPSPRLSCQARRQGRNRHVLHVGPYDTPPRQKLGPPRETH